jgi:hypothetical protein
MKRYFVYVVAFSIFTFLFSIIALFFLGDIVPTFSSLQENPERTLSTNESLVLFFSSEWIWFIVIIGIHALINIIVFGIFLAEDSESISNLIAGIQMLYIIILVKVGKLMEECGELGSCSGEMVRSIYLSVVIVSAIIFLLTAFLSAKKEDERKSK